MDEPTPADAILREVEDELPIELARALGLFLDELGAHDSVEPEEAYEYGHAFLRRLLKVHLPGT